MTTIAGSTRYLNQATLANQQGTLVEAPNILSSAGSSPTSLLDSGRLNTGLGASSSARALNSQFLSRSAQGFEGIFALNGVEFGTIETLQQKILALRAGLPDSALAESLRGGEEVDFEA